MPSRPARVRLSAALLTAGTLAFAASMTLPAVTLWYAPWKDRMTLGGWTCATSYGPTGGTNSFVVLAFAFWGAAHWWRSAWAWWIGAAAGVGAVFVHAFVGAWPALEGIEHLHSGYWTWLAATTTVAVAMLVLPRPERPPPGESISVAERDRGRRGLAVIVGTAAALTVLASHLLLPVPLGGTIVDGPEPPGARPYYYSIGPTSSSGWQPAPRQETLADGSTVEVERHYEYEWFPPAVALFQSPAPGAMEFAYLTLPLLFLAAATTLRAAWRRSGAVLSAALAVASFTLVECPWPCSGLTPHPTDALWQAPACALAVAFVLLPPRRAPVAP